MLRFIQRCLIVSGFLLIGSAGVSLATYHAFQGCALAASIPPPHGPLLGRLEIPRLKLSIAILDNDDPQSLSLAAGYIPGTSPIGSLGNAGIAGHRDTAFRALRFIRVGDRIEAQTDRHTTYVVESIHIVEPSDTGLLRLNNGPSLTLVTCYPFNYVGSAPKRFVVQAKLAL